MTATTKLHHHDPQDMSGWVIRWPELFAAGVQSVKQLPDELRGKREVVCSGMGGSAISAGLIADYAADDLEVPFSVIRGYTEPQYIGPDTLTILMSYSGNTEETLNAYRQARAAGAVCLVVSGGGTLTEMAQADNVPVIKIGLKTQPRAAVPYVVGALLCVLETLRYLPSQTAAVTEAISNLESLVKLSPAMLQRFQADAQLLHGTIPFIYGAELLGEASRRMKGQISENAKQIAAFELLPEHNHNALAGYRYPETLAQSASFVLLRTTHQYPRTAIRFDYLKQLLRDHQFPMLELSGTGAGRLSQLLTVICMGDIISVLLADLNGVDPTPVEDIMGLKGYLSEKE